MSRWTVGHSRQALAEGWDVFLTDNRKLEIQRHDEALRFGSDGEARGFVRVKALGGSKLHKLAMLVTEAPL